VLRGLEKNLFIASFPPGESRFFPVAPFGERRNICVGRDYQFLFPPLRDSGGLRKAFPALAVPPFFFLGKKASSFFSPSALSWATPLVTLFFLSCPGRRRAVLGLSFSERISLFFLSEETSPLLDAAHCEKIPFLEGDSFLFPFREEFPFLEEGTDLLAPRHDRNATLLRGSFSFPFSSPPSAEGKPPTLILVFS